MDVARLDALMEHPLAVQAIGLLSLALVCVAADFVTRRFLVRGIEALVLRSSTSWDDALKDAKVFERLSALVPAVIGWYGVRLLPEVGESVETVVSRVAFSVVIVVVARSILALLTGANAIYASNPANWSRPIKGYVQVVKIGIAVVAAVLILATLLDRSPLIFLSGIGAMTAVLLLIFRDTILSLVASAQITGNDMVRKGDWIEMPQFGADGDVIDVALHTVKVQNWDKTITMIPTHRLISDSFKNWRGMSLAGGRRIKRSLFIDMNSVRFIDEDEVERLEEFALLHDYIRRKRDEIAAYNADGGRNPEINADVRRLTNVGSYRAYLEAYLRSHPAIRQDMTLIVRQRDPTPLGLPIEIYCFTSTTEWAAYEGIQSDLFDHFLAIAPDFGLRVFQSPSGADLAALAPGGRS